MVPDKFYHLFRGSSRVFHLTQVVKDACPDCTACDIILANTSKLISLRLKGQCNIWKCAFGDAVKQIVRSVPELGARVDTVFGNTGIRYTRMDGKFYFAATDMAKLVLWDEEKQTPCQRDLSIYVDRAGAADENLRMACSHTHQFG